MINNASAVHIGNGVDTYVQFTVIGNGHKEAAQRWADGYNALVREDMAADGLDQGYYNDYCATVRPFHVAYTDAMPPVTL